MICVEVPIMQSAFLDTYEDALDPWRLPRPTRISSHGTLREPTLSNELADLLHDLQPITCLVLGLL